LIALDLAGGGERIAEQWLVDYLADFEAGP